MKGRTGAHQAHPLSSTTMRPQPREQPVLRPARSPATGQLLPGGCDRANWTEPGRRAPARSVPVRVQRAAAGRSPLPRLQPRERIAEKGGLLVTDLPDEPDQGLSAITSPVERVTHQVRGHLLAGRGGPVTPGFTIPLARGQVLLGQPVEYRHHGGVGKVAGSCELLMDLADGERAVRGPELLHHQSLEVAEGAWTSRISSHVTSITTQCSRWGASIYYVTS